MKRKLLFITLLMLFCSTVFGQDSYWGTPVRYPSNMTLNANIMINGTVQNSDKLEIGAFCGSELRGATITTIEDGESNVFFTIMGNNGDNISFKLYVPGDGEGTILSTDETIVFYDEALVGFDPLLYINFYEKHWDYTGTPEHTMTIECTISVDGVIQNTENLELAAFYDGELRGVAKPKKYSDDLYLTALQVGGSNGEVISFKLYNSVFGELSSDYTVSFVKDVTLGNEEKLTIEFKNNPVAMITNATGNHYFSSLEAAVDAAQDDETILLLQDVTLTETLTIEKSITIDLNEKNVTLSTGGNMIKSNVTIKNGNLAIADVDTQTTGNSKCFISTEVDASLTFDDINMTGNGYKTHWAVLCAMSGSTAGTGSTINITNSTITLSNEKGSQGGFIKDQSGIDNYSQINISNSTLTLTYVSRGFTGAKVTLDDVEMTITGGEHGINGSELVIKNGSNVSISNGTGRAITLNKFDASIIGSNVTISNMGEGGIRYKTANTLTVDASSTLSETTAHADVDNAKLNDKVVRGTESQMSTVKVENGVTTVINPVSGQVAYRAYINDSDTREAIQVDLQNVNALNSLAVKLYDANGNLLTTTTYRAGAVERPGYLTCNIVLWGEASSSWETVISAEKLTVDNYPHKAELVVDGSVINTFENILGNATDAAAYQLPAYKALGCVYKAASITRNDVTEYYSTIANANAATTDNDVVTILVSTNETIGVPQGNNVTFNALEGVELSGGAGGSYYNKSVTFDGLTFKGGKGIALTAGVDGITYTVKNCTFDGVQATAWKQGVISLNEKATVVVENNIITNVQNATEGDGRINTYGQQSAGIYTSNAVAVTISDNTITNVDGTGISSNSNAGKVDIKDNTVSNWGTGATAKNEGRAIRTSGGTEVAITGNVMIDNGTAKESFVKSTDFTTSLDASMNYWNGQNPVASDLFEADNTDPVNYVKNYYIDVDKQSLVTLSVSVAKVGDKYYQSVNEAINSADDGAIVQLLPGTIEEYVYPWPESNHSKEKSITIVGSKDDEGNLTTTLTGGMYLGYDDSQCREHNIVVKDVNFTGKGILVAGQKNVVIENNKFSNITDCVAAPGSANENAISVIGKNINATVTGNVIDGTASAGINLRDTKTVNVSGNTVTNTVHNSITIQNNTTDTGDNVVIKDNTLSNWGTGGEGRAVRIAGGATVSVNGNVMTKENAPEEFVKVTGTTTIDASANYWNGNNPMTPGMYLGINSDPALELRSYYKDAGKTELVTIGVSVAQIGSNYYATLQEALKAITSGCTLDILTDITITEKWDCRYTGAKITVPVTINGNGKTIEFTGNVDDKNWNTLFRFEDEATVKNLTLDASAATGIQRGITFKTSVTVDNCTLIGNGTTARYAVIVGEGAGTAIGEVTANITNSTFKDWIKGVTDNMNGQDMNVFAITGCTFDNTDVIISAYEKVTFTGNNMSSNSYVNITSHTVPNNVQVVAIDNTNLATNTETECNQIAAPLAKITAQDGFLKPVAEINGKYFTTLQAAINAAAEDETVKLLADVNYSLDPSTFTAKHGDDDAALFVLADDKLTIDLNGNTISVVATLPEGAATAHSGAIINNGDLTIDDSSVEKEGKVTFKYVGIYDDGYKRHGVVMNLGTLTVNAGTLENVTELQNQQAIDNTNYNKTEVSVVINGGTIKSAGYYAIDMVGYYDFAPALKNSVVINNGTIDGGVYARIQNNTNLSLNITGGVIKSDFAEAVRYRVHYPGNTHSISITGGEFSTTNAESQVVRVQLAEGESLAGFISAGTFSQDVNEFCAAGFMCVENDNGTYGVVVDPDYNMVAKIGETRYATLSDAFAEAAQTEELTTIELLPVTIEEGTVELPATLKNVTVKGAEGAVLKDMTIMAHDGNSINYEGITFDGVVFENSCISVTGWRNNGAVVKNFTVTNCVFKKLDNTTNVAPVHFNMAATEPVNGFTFTNNVIDGATGGSKSGVYAQVTGETVFTGNTINNVAFRPYVIQLTTDDGIADNFTVTGNTFSGSAAGRVQALGNNAEGTDDVTLTVSNNIFKGITNAQQICYWNFNAEKTTATLEKNYYDIDITANPSRIYYNSTASSVDDLYNMGIYPIYTELKEDGTINEESLFEPVAYNGTVAYETLAEAFAGQDGTIVLLENIELTEGVVVAADKTFTLDLNGKVVSGVSNTAATSAVITNNGNLTVKTSVEGGKITSKANNPDQNSTPAYANNTITNCGVLTLLSGTIENSTEQGLACFPIDNNSTSRNAIVNIKGGTVTGRGAIRQFANSETNENTVNVEGGVISGTSYAIWVLNPSDGGNTVNTKDTKAKLNILAGELGKILLEASAEFEVAISGGTISEVAFWETDVTNPERNPSDFITGGTFGMDVTEFCAFNYVCTSNGDGTYGIEYKQQENNAFVIKTLHELIAFRNAVNAGNTFEGQTVVLSDDVDLNPTRAINIWEPIGTSANPFKGTFDGGDNTIIDLVVEGENNVGLFGYADNATIKNIKLENVNVKGTDCVGAIAGQVYSTSLIDNCHVSGSIQVEGQTNVGGIVGKYYTKVKNCSVIGDDVATSYVKGTYVASDFEGDNIGGIMGHGGEDNRFENNTVKNITISGTRKVAGIVGVTDMNTQVKNCVVENVNIETTATTEYANSKKNTMSNGTLVGSYTTGNNTTGTVESCVVKNVNFLNPNNAVVSVGPITGGLRGGTDGMLAPTGVTASGNNIYMSTITGSNNLYLMNAVAKIGETEYYTLFDAVAAVQNGETKTITMLRNTSEEFAIDNTTANITLDMAGFTLNGAITPSKANLTIKGGTINNENASYSAIEINEGSLNLSDVNIESKRHGVRIDGAVEAIINGGTYKPTATSGTRHAVNVSGAANVTIKAGTFVGPKGTTMDSGSAVNVQTGATVTINGGDFSGGKNHTLSAAGTLIVKGGTFDQDPSAYLADAYTVNIENEMYVVRYTPIMVTYPVGNPVYPEGKVEYYSDMLEAVPYTTNCPRLEGATITLLADVSGEGMRFMENDMVFDLNGHTYTITDGTGSQGTNTSGFQIRPEVTTNVLFKDGTIKVAEGAPVVWMFNCYATDFIVENVTVDCSNMAYSYGEGVYVVVSRSGDNVQLKGQTKIANFDSTVAGYAINVGGTMTIGEEVGLGENAVIELDGGAQLTAPAGLNVVTVDGYMVVYENGVYKSVKVVAQVGDVKYESVAAAMTAAKEAGVKDLEITIIGENTQDTDDSFNLSYATAFDNVTIKQDNDNKPFYIKSIYTGDRTSTDGKFVFDGVNMIITEQIWFECDVVLTNNSSVKRSNDVKNFIYYGEVTVEPGSKYISQIDDVMAGSFTVDGGKTDGTYNEAEDFKTVFFDVRYGQTFTAKNGANILISSGEGGKLSLMGNANIDASKVYVYNEIALGDNGQFAIDIESSVTTKNVTGKGVISVDALNINEGVVYNVITANMSSFAGIIEINNDDAEYEITSTGLVVKMKPFVAEVDGTQFTSLQRAFDAVQDNGTITLLRDVTFDLTTVGYQDENWVDGVRYNGDKSFTVNFNTYKVTDNGCVNDYLININNKGEKDNEITFTNGTIESANGCWATVCVGAESSTHKTVLNLNDMNIINKNDASYSGNLAVRVRGTADVNTTVNVNTGTTITSDGASYGIAPSTNGAVVNINSGAIIEQKNSGTSGGNSVFAAVGGKGTVNIYDGAIIGSDSYGVHTMTTGTPVVNIYGGTITAEVALKASTNGVDGQSSTINVSGGMITGALEEYTDNAQIILTGGTFSTDVNEYCHEYYDAIQGDDNLWRVEQVLFAQTTALQGGWNWYSSYINLASDEELVEMQNAFDGKGLEIKGKTGFSDYQYIGDDENGVAQYKWYKTEDFSISAKQMYMIKTTEALDLVVDGKVVNPAANPISLKVGWNWIGYPMTENVAINVALANATDGDIIKARNGQATYSTNINPETNEIFGWVGTLTTLTPGQGYKYQSNANRVLVYSRGDRGSKYEDENITFEDNYWVPAVSEYANNMTITAMLSIDSEIVKENYEIAAFANGECRGSARPIYVEGLDSYMLFMTIYGEGVEELTFKCYDVNYGTEYELSDRINYSDDAIVGSFNEPYMFNLDILNIEESSVEDINIYPNPTTTSSEINLQAMCDKVEVFNALGVKVAEYSNVDSIDALETAGIYVIRVTIDGNARNCRLVVK